MVALLDPSLAGVGACEAAAQALRALVRGNRLHQQLSEIPGAIDRLALLLHPQNADAGCAAAAAGVLSNLVCGSEPRQALVAGTPFVLERIAHLLDPSEWLGVAENALDGKT